MEGSVTRLGYYWTILATNFLTKVAQMFTNILGYYEKWHFKKKNYFNHFLGNFWLKLHQFPFQHLVTLIEGSA